MRLDPQRPALRIGQATNAQTEGGTGLVARAMPAHEQLSFDTPACQRWTHRRHTWRRTSEGGFDPARYRVRELPQAPARAFVQTHHYSGTWPAVRLQYALIDTAATDQASSGEAAPGALVGVLALGIPMHVGVLTGVFDWLTPYRQSLELSRLVLLDEVPAPAESWFAARCFKLAAARGIRGIIAHSDPHARTRHTPAGPELLFPGHVGTIYQASGMRYLGRTRPRRLVVLPDASVLTDRAMAKVRADEVGHRGTERRLVALGARPRRLGEVGRDWLAEALDALAVTVLDHGGNHRYATVIGPRHGRRPITATAYPYPKKHPGGWA